MRITNKITFLMILFATFIFANPICVNLCNECINTKKEYMCKKINEQCKCKNTLDSAKIKNEFLKQSKDKLISDITNGCGKTACSRNLTFINGVYSSIEKGYSPLSSALIINGAMIAEQKIKNQKPLALKKEEFILDSLIKERKAITFSPMTVECNNKCNSCNANNTNLNELSIKTDSITKLDSLQLKKDSITNIECQKTEKICMCKLYKENEIKQKEIDELIKNKNEIIDTLSKKITALLHEEMGIQIADTTHYLCDNKDTCIIEITFTSENLALLELHKVIKETSITNSQITEPIKNETQKNDSIQNCVQVENSDPDTTDGNHVLSDNERIFFKAAEFTYGRFSEKNFPNIYEDNSSLEGRFGFILRWYFYDGGAISTGLSGIYHLRTLKNGDNKNGQKYSYQSFSLDLPISLRLGIPKIPYIKPFISETFIFQKPIYQLQHNELFSETQENIDNWKHVIPTWHDKEYTVWIGFGLELTRKLSAEYQMMLGSKASGNKSFRYNDSDTWRIVVNLAW